MGDTGKRRPKRNVNGEGNIRQRSDGRWEGRAYVVTTDGREIRKSVYGSSWDDVHDKLTKLQADRMSGRRIADTKETVGRYLERWLRDEVHDRVRETTFRTYEWVVRVHLIPTLGKKSLARLSPGDIRGAYKRLRSVCQCCALGKDKAREERARKARARQKGRPRKNARPIEGARCCALTPRKCCNAVLSEGSIRQAHRVLRSALQDAVVEELIADNPAKKVRLRDKYRPKVNAWTGGEARRFLTAARDDRWYALYAVALSLGLRRGEALGLRWSDVDLDAGVLHVRQALHRVNGQLVFGLVKSDDSERQVAVPATCLAVLREHRRRQNAARQSAGQAWVERGLVFTTGLGTPIEPRNVNRHFAKLCDKAGVRRIRFHDLRHSCATLLYEQGVPLDNIQDVLGHSSPTITKMIYIEVTRKVQLDAVDRLGYLFDDSPDDEADAGATGSDG